MASYLTAVFRMLYAAQPGLQARMGMSAEELADVTTMQCFENADSNADGQLSLAEFKAFYKSNSTSAIGKMLVDVPRDLGTAPLPSPKLTLEQVQAATLSS